MCFTRSTYRNAMSSGHIFCYYNGIRWVRNRSNCCSSSRRSHQYNRTRHRTPFVCQCNRRSCKLPDSPNKLLVADMLHSCLHVDEGKQYNYNTIQMMNFQKVSTNERWSNCKATINETNNYSHYDNWFRWRKKIFIIIKCRRIFQ